MTVEIIEGFDVAWLGRAMEIFNQTELKRTDRDLLEKAFLNSYVVMSAWVENRLIGVGRMISDGAMYACIHDVVIDPAFQRKGIGRSILNALIAKAPNACIFLTSTFGNEPFYSSLGFRKHKTAMALYPFKLKESPYLE